MELDTGLNAPARKERRTIPRIAYLDVKIMIDLSSV